jgi:hypothetical protein
MSIEKLTNCPQCGGILNEAGRCEFCGSKVYDFLTFNFTGPYHKFASAKTYIRIKQNGKIVIAPVTVDTMEVNHGDAAISPCALGYNSYDLKYPCYPTIDVCFRITGDTTEVEE